MGKRDDRLHSPEAFKQALMTRPISRNGFVMVYRISLSEGMRLGFILPGKLIRSAVVRNQIKRWARMMFRQTFRPVGQGPEQNGVSPGVTPSAYVIRIVQKVSKDHWQTVGRALWKQQFEAVLGAAFARAGTPTVAGQTARGISSR